MFIDPITGIPYEVSDTGNASEDALTMKYAQAKAFLARADQTSTEAIDDLLGPGLEYLKKSALYLKHKELIDRISEEFAVVLHNPTVIPSDGFMKDMCRLYDIVLMERP